jgi:acetyl esterase/lipase
MDRQPGEANVERVRWRFSLPVLLVVASFSQAQGLRPNLPDGSKAHRDLEYVRGGHERQRLDLYLPEKADRPLPVIVWVHGGAWLAGSKEGGGPALSFVRRGYAVASINYRLSQHARFPAQIEDCKAAIRWLRANAKTYGLDPDHIGVWGASAGGHLVALLGTSGDVKELEGKDGPADQSSRVQAVVDWFGPTDVTKMGGSHDGPDSPEARLLGGPVQENKEKAERANPIAYVTKDDPPFLILHGDKDTTVPFSQSELLEEALRKAGLDVTFRPVKGAGHGGREFSSEENRKLVEEFFDKHLKKGS